MMVSAYEAFIMMYYILDAALDEMQSESVRQWASDSNPFLFKGIGSADPAVYIEFKEAWDKKFGKDAEVSYAECKTFIADYLAGLSSDCRKAFDAIVDDAQWEDQMKEVQGQAQERIGRMSNGS